MDFTEKIIGNYKFELFIDGFLLTLYISPIKNGVVGLELIETNRLEIRKLIKETGFINTLSAEVHFNEKNIVINSHNVSLLKKIFNKKIKIDGDDAKNLKEWLYYHTFTLKEIRERKIGKLYNN